MPADHGLPRYQDLPVLPTDSSIRSAWGLFGEHDEIGTLNLITPDVIRRAAGLVRWGMVNGNTVDEGTPETVDLGRLRLFSPAPGRTYTGARFTLRGWKEFKFRMPRRAEQSGIRLGYVLRVGGEDIRLMSFATAAW